MAIAFFALARSAGGALPPRDYGAVFSPDGKRVAFIRRQGTSQSLMVVGVDGKGLRRVTSAPLIQYLTWAPDSANLAYTCGTEICRVDLATGTVEQLTHTPEEDWQPSWSPDGTQIVWDRFERCFRCTGVWLMNADGSNQHEIVQQSEGRRPTWSPDGTKIALSLANELVIDPSGETILQGGGAYTAWSPRGVYVVDDDLGLRIHNLVTGTSRVLTKVIVAKPAWSPDGTVIAGESSGLHVAIVRAKDGKLVSRLPLSNTGGGGPSWSPAGLLAFAHSKDCGIDVAREDGTLERRLTRVC
jgi:Tol biopolymer transport system component